MAERPGTEIGGHLEPLSEPPSLCARRPAKNPLSHFRGTDVNFNSRGVMPMEPEKLPANAANMRRIGPDLIMLILLIGCTAYVLLQFT